MEEIGIILKKENGFAVVEVRKGSECKACQAKDACPESAQEGYKIIRAKNEINAEKGDKVLLECTPSTSLISSFVVFIFPLLFCIAGYFVGSAVFGPVPEYKPILTCLASFIIAFLIIRYADRQYFSKKSEFIPSISEKID